MNRVDERALPAGDAEQKRRYQKPTVTKVDLALVETLSSGCKLAGVCDDPFTGTSEAGS